MTRITTTDMLNLRGADELKAMLKQLPEKLGRKIERKAMVVATEAVHTEVLRRVPTKHGDLKASIKVKVRKKRQQYIGSITAGGEKAYHAQFIEYGFVHTGHKIKGKDGKPTSRGHVPGRKFMRGAIASKAQSVVDIFTDTLKEFAEKEIAKVQAKK
jgi:HK97 gp10 family phage protein